VKFNKLKKYTDKTKILDILAKKYIKSKYVRIREDKHQWQDAIFTLTV
jgi:hypothetical protein